MLVGMAMDAHAMTQLFATGHEAFALVTGSGAWLATGGLVGVFHFLTLQRSTRMLASGSSLLPGLALHLVRFAITACALGLISAHGALPLLAAMLGILASRTAVLSLGAPL
jgi:F1-F0 ATPase (N-ATPase) AtpR subunit